MIDQESLNTFFRMLTDCFTRFFACETMTSYFTPSSEDLDYSVLAVCYDFCFCYYYCLVVLAVEFVLLCYLDLADVALELALLHCLALVGVAVGFVLLHYLVDVAVEAFDYLAVDVAVVLAIVLQHYLADFATEVFDYFPVVVALAVAFVPVADVDLDCDFAPADSDYFLDLQVFPSDFEASHQF